MESCSVFESKGKARAEAIKEFVERVKKDMLESKYKAVDTPYTRTCNKVVDYWVNELDQIAKEMGCE